MSFYRLLTIQQDVGTTKNNSGEPVVSWAQYCQVWGERVLKVGSERSEGDKRTASGVYVYKTRYYTGITPKMRLIDGNETMEIVSVTETKRQLQLQIEAVVKV